MSKRTRKYEIPVKTNSAAQVERTLELADVDGALAERTFPGARGQSARMRQLFMDFLAALRLHGSPAKGNRSITVYLQGDELVSLFTVRNYLIDLNIIRNRDSMSSVVAVALQELAKIVKPKPDKVSESSESSDAIEIPVQESLSNGERRDSAEPDGEPRRDFTIVRSG